MEYSPYDNIMDQPIDWDDRDVEPIGEMATILKDKSYNLTIQVNPDKNRKGVPYFKVFNHAKVTPNETSVARLHFLDSGMEFHKDSFKDWIPTNKDIEIIHDVMNQKYKHTDKTIWQMTCMKWNYEYDNFYSSKVFDEDEYFDGIYDNDPDFCKHPSYVPSDTPIPDTWK